MYRLWIIDFYFSCKSTISTLILCDQSIGTNIIVNDKKKKYMKWTMSVYYTDKNGFYSEIYIKWYLLVHWMIWYDMIWYDMIYDMIWYHIVYDKTNEMDKNKQYMIWNINEEQHCIIFNARWVVDAQCDVSFLKRIIS
jgi:hypothetical protein